MLTTLFGVTTKGLGEETKVAEMGMYGVPLMVGVTKFLVLGIVWISR